MGGSANNAGSVTNLAPDTQDLDNDGDIAEDLPVDARGFARVSGSTIDLGAVQIDEIDEIDESSPLKLTFLELDQAGNAILSFEVNQLLGANEILVLSRSSDLENFDSIFVYDGAAVVEEEIDDTSSFDSGTGIFTVTDTNPPQQRAFYRLEISSAVVPGP